MEVIFRSNDSLSKYYLGAGNGAKRWLDQSLGKYLSDSALIRLDMFTTGIDEATATLNIVDGKLHVYAKSNVTSRLTSIEEVIKKATVQLLKHKEKNNLYFGIVDDECFYSDGILNDYKLQEEILSLEESLNDKKSSKYYKRITNKYVKHLYDIKEIEDEIRRAEIQLNVLYNIMDNEFDTILHYDYILLTKSIEQIEKQINLLINKKNKYKMNNRDQEYINETIDEELKILNLKRR